MERLQATFNVEFAKDGTITVRALDRECWNEVYRTELNYTTAEQLAQAIDDVLTPKGRFLSGFVRDAQGERYQRRERLRAIIRDAQERLEQLGD